MAFSPYKILSLISIIFTIFTSMVSSLITAPNNNNTSTITIPLSPLLFTNNKHNNNNPPNSSLDQYQSLKLHAYASITRAHHLKHHKSKKGSSPSIIKTQVHPKSYGGYSIDLKFGTPPQTFSFVLDTGSSLVWLPCSSHYLCSKCNIDTNKISTFIPKKSSTSKLIGCKSPKCAWIFGPNVECQNCQERKQNNCSQICPAYTVQYGLGTTAGFLLSENLNLPKKIVPNFLVGCSVLSMYQPAGIVGLGRGPESLPRQMDLKKFSYCLLSHRFDDSREASDLVLHGGRTAGKTAGVSYTPFDKNPAGENTAFATYYYIPIRKVIVGGKHVKIPANLLEPDSAGNGGSIVDSGTTFTFMDKPIFDAVAREFENQVNLTRNRVVEKRSGLSPCFTVAANNKTTSFPALTLQFRGGAKMILPPENYFSFVGAKSDVACFTIVSDEGFAATPSAARGPAVILGNYQQQNFYVEYDLENEKFGFRRQNCKRSG
ncbi:aspartic proteinase nepenthesin-2-like [Arachis stenosperma]|uniref:aspartic proteinase nepenthesin-2-like n=1 Tax=Arachis stenosperma TaxID=217475 RepID=UPI0025ACC86B|nr:aspartic proteinase nepenthesin-2-like [Arachis stenosperma]